MGNPRFVFPTASPRPALSRGGGVRVLNDDPEVCSPLETCGGMIADVDREISSARADLSARAIKVIRGAFIEYRGPYRIYRLVTLDPVPPLRLEQAVVAEFIDGTTLASQVYSAGDHIVRLATMSDVEPARWEDCRLVVDDLWLLERLRGRLALLRESLSKGLMPPDFNVELAQLSIGHGDFDQNVTISSFDVDDPSVEHLNERQREVIREALRRRVAYIWGPPGTGKTTTLAALVHVHIRSGKRVLVVAPSNAAADVLAISLASRLANSPEFDQGLLLRVGPRPTQELQRQYGDKVVPQQIVQRLAAERFGRERAALEREINELQAVASQKPDPCVPGDIGQRLVGVRAALHRLDQNERAFAERAFDELLDHSRALVAPAHNVYLSRQIRGQFDVVVVDEASMVLMPQLYLAAGLARTAAVIAGDFQQLPGPVVHRARSEVPWLATDVFSKIGIPDDVAREDDPDYLLMLTEQYRMAPTICDLISHLFYMGRLTTASEARRRPIPGPCDLGALVLVDTGGLCPRADLPRGTLSRINDVHARLAKDLIAMLLDNGQTDASSDLLVLSPYAAQVQLLHSILAPERLRLGTALRVSTVHRAQGSEAGTVVLSIDDAPGAPISRFMAARDWRSAGSRLLNVGISRARDRVLLLADIRYLERAGGGVVRCVIEAMRDRGQVIRAEEIPPIKSSDQG